MSVVGELSDFKPADVWSRTASKYRRRAVLLLAVDLLLFTGLCLFAYWLRTGDYLPLDRERYIDLLYRSLKISGPGRISLADLPFYPISVARVPLHMVILALLMASLISIPILVAILYRFAAALPFLAAVGFVAVLPWLAITLTVSCILASVRPFRMSFRFSSALLSLLPVVVYFWIALRGGSTEFSLGRPIEQFKLYAPWALALLAACFNFAVVLSIAAIVGYRPGAIAPMLAVLFAVPVILFETKVGEDELYFSILESRYGVASQECFRAENISDFLLRWPNLLTRYEESIGDRRRALDEISWQWQLDLTSVKPLKRRVERLALMELERDRGEVVVAADRFVADFPKSRRIPAVLYLKGRALDMRLDLLRLREDGLITYYDDFPGTASQDTWRIIAESYSDSPFAAVAMYKYAIQSARFGRLDQARQMLTQLCRRFSQQRRRREIVKAGWFAWLQSNGNGPASAGIDLQAVVTRSRKLLEVLESNASDPKYGVVPVAVWLRMDPHSVYYRQNLQLLDERCPGSLMHDNLQLFWILTLRSVSRKIELLTQHIKRFEGQDSVRQAMYELGRLLEVDARLEEAAEVYDRLARQFPGSVWGDLAGQRAAILRLRLGR